MTRLQRLEEWVKDWSARRASRRAGPCAWAHRRPGRWSATSNDVTAISRRERRPRMIGLSWPPSPSRDPFFLPSPLRGRGEEDKTPLAARKNADDRVAAEPG